MRASYGTLQLLGLKAGGYPFSPKTAFFLLGESCQGGCAFCPQANGQDGLLSRITWPEIKLSEIISTLKNTEVDRICIQAVKKTGMVEEVLDFLKRIKKLSEAPVSVSMSISSISDAQILFDAGADTVSVALDCASKKLATEIKSINFEKTKSLLVQLAKIYPGKTTTHLIAGLGETDKELSELSREMIKAGINVSLFAFTPVKGTRLEGKSQPSLTRYRKLQATLALLRVNIETKFEYDKFENINLPDGFENILKPPDFQTPGCAGCNRPYYNERPGGVIYNHPNPPDLKNIMGELE